ncbi:MAG: hypothetical protein GY750_08025 [Lentisphaerae bacterium]|nr:hypothetical protein [Lentisphaerota bacterium]MCP4101355.1 hypothetical protein [Lentisphaerota bacterium]
MKQASEMDEQQINKSQRLSNSDREYTTSIMPIWSCQLANYLFYKKFLQAYKAEEMMIYQIKWQKNMAAGTKQPKDISKIIEKLESSRSIRSGFGMYFNYNDDDIVNYFLRDGMDIPGNANGFIKSSGIGKELVGTVDFGKLINPLSYSDSISLGNLATVSLAASPSLKIAMGAKYDKNPATFILQVALPWHHLLGLNRRNYLPKYFWKMSGCKIQKKFAAAFSLGFEATAGITMGPSKNDASIFDEFDNACYDAAAQVSASSALYLSALDASCKYSVETKTFVAEQAAYFRGALTDNLIQKGCIPMKKALKNDILNVLHPYDLDKNRYYQQQKGLFDGRSRKGWEIHNFVDRKAYIMLLTTNKGYEANLGHAKGYIDIGASASANPVYTGGDGTYLSDSIGVNKVGFEANLITANAEAFLYQRKAQYKNRKARLFLPFKLTTDPDEQCYYNQDTEIVYTKEKSCSYLGFSATLNKFCSLSLIYDPFHDDLDDDWLLLKKKVTEEPSFYYMKKKSVAENKKVEKVHHKVKEYHENSLMYTSINTIFRKDRHHCEGSCFNVGKSIDITPLTLFYEKYFRILAVYETYAATNLKGSLIKDIPHLSRCLKNRGDYSDLKEKAIELIQIASRGIPELSNRKNKLSSFSRFRNIRRPQSESNKDLVLLKYSVKKFKKDSANRFYERRKSITAVDDALAKYWTHVKAFSVADVRNAKGVDIFKELNARIGLLNTIVDECNIWMGKHHATNLRCNAVESLIRACKMSIYYYASYEIKPAQRTNKLFAKKSEKSIKFSLLLEYEKLLSLFKSLNGMFKSIRVSPKLGLDYILPGSYADHREYLWEPDQAKIGSKWTGSAHKKHPGVIGLIYDLVEHENVKAVIFETVFKLKLPKYLGKHGIHYYPKDSKKEFKDIKLPNKDLLLECKDDNNVGIRLIYRREDSFENRKYIFQLGTRLMPVQSREKLDINLSFSYQHEQSAFTGISLYSASNPQKYQDQDDPQLNEINKYMKTILIS